MKKSVFWRLLVVFIILVVWALSIFPYQDRPFLKVLDKQVRNKDDAYGAVIKEAKRLSAEQHITIPKAVERAANLKNVKLADYVSVYRRPDASNREVVGLIRRKAAGKLKLGLDLRGGTEFTIAFNKADIPEGKEAIEVRDEIIEVLRNRVDQSGVVEPEIKPEGETYISVKIPSIRQDETQEIRKLLQQTARLTFHLVGDASKKDDPAYEKKEVRDENGVLKETIYIKRRPEAVTGRHLKRAYPDVDQFGTYFVSLQFNNQGAALFYDVTREYAEKRLAIVLDGTVYSAPRINEPIPGGSAQITGSFSLDEARQLAIVLRCGNLPVSIDIQAEFSTDPTLGADSVRSGRNAALLGLALVVLFMVVYYLSAGVIADLALAANVVLVLGTLTIAGATITLPGIAGIVLTIGMAVDANVLIFERIREELLNKKSLANAIHNGYDRAFVTILDANITTLITAFILYRFGSGSVRGFAVTLSIGILASMSTALFMTRALFDLLLLGTWFKNVKMMHLLRRPHFNFLRQRRLAAMLSGLLILVGAVNLAYRGRGVLSVDFTGGTALSFSYDPAGEPSVSDVRRVFTEAGYKDVRLTYKRSTEEATKLLEIVLSGVTAGDNDLKAEVLGLLNGTFKEAHFKGGATKEIGGLVGRKFRSQAAIAMLLAILGIIAYITVRFEFSYAMGAVVALVHDVAIGAGVYLLFLFGERQISLPVIAALLTIMGYSLNDTIVVFDRIRENLGLHGKKKKYLDILNASINDTLSRTLLTSWTTLLVVLTLFFLGGGAINDFALVMLIGVVVGTYSSIFIATPVMIWFHRRREAAAAADGAAAKTHKAVA